ncbi:MULTISPECIES: chlorophyll a/b-binding protein [unclassified Cyanobium]|uniref:chlorophyll a/b-binding protein n=1 Tax=unclassified Cyanobium TaxID=2627006 RepID=UPI0016454C8D|nr:MULTISPECIES: chlorophyll a/b-binding protein [unclassified Cyanobium]MBE9153796.1 high light inducible protein [Cyanobium sp. LEGE 06113]QNI70961.1 high light inducible protein [Cyanobium sp. NS01]
MTSSSAGQRPASLDSQELQQRHLEQLQNAERFNGRAAMVGLVIGVVVEGLTGFGIAHQIGLGALVDGYAACRTNLLPFCF